MIFSLSLDWSENTFCIILSIKNVSINEAMPRMQFVSVKAPCVRDKSVCSVTVVYMVYTCQLD